MERKQFLKNSLAATGLFGFSSMKLIAQPFQQDPQLDKKLVEEFVGASHRDMEKTKPLLEEHPTLLNAAHDWKFGDFETGLGAASHVGYKELARYYIDKGAQANIFTACLFGKIEIVKAMITAFPNTMYAKGPHGYTLLHHAQRGGEEAREVKEYLESLGCKETRFKIY